MVVVASKKDHPQHPHNSYISLIMLTYTTVFFRTELLFCAGRDSMFDKMDQVREQQEGLAKLHFELDSQQEMKG